MTARTHGVLTSVRHLRIGSDPDAGATTCALVKVATADKRDPDHREIRHPSTNPVHVVPATGYTHAAYPRDSKEIHHMTSPTTPTVHGGGTTPHVVTICGSTRFRDQIAAANGELTLAGYVVLAPGVFAHDGDPITAADKQRLDRLHLVKIDLACWVLVVNPGGYIGDSTRREITHASATGKPVHYLEQVAA